MKDWNAARYDARDEGPAPRPGRVESYFLKANDPSGELAVWLKATVFSPRAGEAWAEGWAVVFDKRGGERRHAAFKHRLPLGEARFSRAGLDVGWTLADGQHLHLREGETRGEIRSQAGAVRWSLAWTPVGGALVPFSPLALYELAFPKQKLVSPTPHARFTGRVEIVGRDPLELDGWPGMQGHNWGRGHSDLYGWAHASAWDDPADEGIVVECGAAELQLGAGRLSARTPPLPFLLVRDRGREWRFSDLVQVARNRASISTTSLRVVADGRDGRVEAAFDLDRDDVVGLLYENPEGPPTYCLNSKLARGRVSLALRGELPRTLTTRRAALEVGTKDPSHGFRVYA